MVHIDGLVQGRHNSSALAMELCLSYTNPSMYALEMNYIIIGSDNGLLRIWCQTITWTKAGLLSVRPLKVETNISNMWI